MMNNEYLFPDAKIKETLENRLLRTKISRMLSEARSRKDEGILEEQVDFLLDMTKGQAIKMRDSSCRIWMNDNGWFYNDVVDGELVRVYEEVIENGSKSKNIECSY